MALRLEISTPQITMPRGGWGVGVGGGTVAVRLIKLAGSVVVCHICPALAVNPVVGQTRQGVAVEVAVLVAVERRPVAAVEVVEGVEVEPSSLVLLIYN